MENTNVAQLVTPHVLTKLSVTGYKSIVNRQEIEIRPLTILSGANSSGKSSVVQPLLLLKQTFDAPYDPGSLLLGGVNVRLTSANQLLSRTAKNSFVNECSFGFEVDGVTISIDFRRQPGRGLEVSRNVITVGERQFEIRPEADEKSLVELAAKWMNRFPDDPFARKPMRRKYSVARDRSFLVVNVVSDDLGFTFPLIQPGTKVVPIVGGLIHVPGLRGNPERNYPTTSIGDRFPGTFESYVASVIYHWQQTKDERLGALGENLEALGLTWKVHAQQVDDTQVELKVGRLPHSRRGGAHDLVSIADVGFGVSQTLPVLVALLAAKPGQVVYIEQPEIHLHPRAQRALADVLAGAARRGVVVIVETHSALLMQGVQTLVAQDSLDPSLVALHWVERDNDGATVVRAGRMDGTGAFGDWPVDFDDVHMQSESEYLDAAERKLFAHARTDVA